MKKIVVLTGAGISAESGIKTFREAGGLWEEHDVMEVASPEGFRQNPELVLEFYNQRRRHLLGVQPNRAHKSLVDLEAYFETVIITQNIDDLHERAGSSLVLHLHGELLKARSSSDPGLVYPWKKDIRLGDTCALGSQLRPDVVWFGEAVPMLEAAVRLMVDCDAVLIVGSSMQVYPAASLTAYAPEHADMYYIDPNPGINYELSMRQALRVIAKRATTAVPEVVSELIRTHAGNTK